MLVAFFIVMVLFNVLSLAAKCLKTGYRILSFSVPVGLTYL